MIRLIQSLSRGAFSFRDKTNPHLHLRYLSKNTSSYSLVESQVVEDAYSLEMYSKGKIEKNAL